MLKQKNKFNYFYSFFKVFLVRTFYLFAFLFICVIPYPYNVIPKISSLVLPFFETATNCIGAIFFKEKPSFFFAVNSDTLGLYLLVLLLLITSLSIAFIWTCFFTTNQKKFFKTYYWTRVTMSYYLALQLLIYGFDKVFKHQFYLPEPNTLYTPLGYLTKDILYWSTMGASYSYTVFSGVIEVLSAIFLLFRQTRIIGAILSIAIMTHVLMLNFSFDISVKVFSAFLLLLSLFISFTFLKKNIRYFLFNETIAVDFYQISASEYPHRIVKKVVKFIMVIIIFFEALHNPVSHQNFNDDWQPRPFLHGAYNTTCCIKNNDTISLALTDSNYIKRFFIHRQGYFITQFLNDDFQDYTLHYNISSNELIIDNSNGTTTTLNYKWNIKDRILRLNFTDGISNTTYIAKQINLKTLPLLQPCFHWTADEF